MADDRKKEKEKESPEVDETEAAPDPTYEKAQRQRSDAPPSEVALGARDDRDIYEWLKEVTDEGQFKVFLTRLRPKLFKGRQVGGHLGTYDNLMLSKDEILQEHGGGVFEIKVQRMVGGKSRFQQRTIEIAGDPKFRETETHADGVGAPPPPTNENPRLVERAMDAFKEMSEADRRRRDELERESRAAASAPKTVDPSILAVLDMLKDQNRVLQEELRSLRAAPKQDTIENKVVEKLIDTDNARITSLKASYESELRQLRQASTDDVKRAEDRMQRLIETQEKGHEREVANLKSSYEHQIKMLELSYTSQVKALENQVTHLQTELTTTKTELATLRASKDKPMTQTIEEIATMKDLFSGVFGGGEEAEKSTVEKIFDAALNSPLARAAAGRIQNAQPVDENGNPIPQPQPQPQTQATQQARRRAAVQAARQRGQGGQPQQPQQQPQPAPENSVQVDPEDVKQAITLMEAAMRNGTSPVDFANTVRSMVPANIIQGLKSAGADSFLQQVMAAGLIPNGSSLDSMAGRNFIRAVVKAL